MSDYNSSLPVRTEANGDVAVRIVDGTITSQQLTVEADGSINVNAIATNLDIRDLVFATDKVDVSGSEVSLSAGSLAALENITVSATDLDIRNLVFATDKVDVTGSEVSLSSGTLSALESITVQNGAGAAAVNIQDGGNSITVDGTLELGATTLAALESITVTATDLDIRNLTFATDKVDVTGSEVSLDATTLAALENITVSATDLDVRDLAFATDKVDVSGSTVVVTATDLDIRNLSHTQDSIKIGDGTDFLAVNTDGSINVVISDASPGTAINDYDTTAAVAAGASDNHDYTSVGNFYLNQIHASASSKMKIEVLVNAVTKFVFFNSTANPNMDITIANPILATTGQVVRIIRTNKDNQAQDVYSTISGYNA